MELPSIACFHPPHISGRQHWGISQLNNPGNTLLPGENPPFTLHPTELLRGNIDGDNALGLDFDSTSVDALDTDWMSEAIAGHVRASLTPGPTISHDAGFKAASTDTSTKSTTEHSETKLSLRYIDEKPEVIICTCSKKEKRGGNNWTCPWKDCKNPGPFSRKSVLARHVKTQHENPRSFKCPSFGCEKLFNRRDNMVGHIRSHHGNGW